MGNIEAVLKSYYMNMQLCSKKGGTLSLLCILIVLFMPCVVFSTDKSSASAGNENSYAKGDVGQNEYGPTILLGYSEENFKKNPISSFMYFVPLIAPTLVDNISSADNKQQVGIISYRKKVRSKSFYLACEFKMIGNGFHINTFDPSGMIAAHIDELKKDETLKSTLDYIKFEGGGFGLIEVRGTIDGSVYTVTKVDIQFDARGYKSPVTVGLYDIIPRNGSYEYENRSNKTVARVNTLSFEKTQGTPRMGIKIASISDKEGDEGFFSALKGLIANLFISPTKVEALGNETMLNFGYALLEKAPEFTFPKARNIKESRSVQAD